MEQVSELKFSDTGVCEVMTTERSESFVYSKQTPSQANRAILLTPDSGGFERVSDAEEVLADESDPSYAEEVVVHPEEVEHLNAVDDEVSVSIQLKIYSASSLKNGGNFHSISPTRNTGRGYDPPPPRTPPGNTARGGSWGCFKPVVLEDQSDWLLHQDTRGRP